MNKRGKVRNKKADSHLDFESKKYLLTAKINDFRGPKKHQFFLESKRSLEMPFSWLFAIIVGGIIIVLAVYVTTQLGGSSKYKQQTETAKEITILIDPLETGIASMSGDVIVFARDTQLLFKCSEPTMENAFGKETLAVSEKLGIGKTWETKGGEIAMRNKFIFADETEEGKKLYVFSKQFFMGFKVGDLIMASSSLEGYCFVKAPANVADDLDSLAGFDNINLSSSIENCPSPYVKVCFGEQDYNCNISVTSDDDYQTGVVFKEEGQVSFVGDLLYGAIFSSMDIYECNVKRLAAKTAELAAVYREEANIVAIKNCNTAIESELDSLASLSKTLQASGQLPALYAYAKEMDNKNKGAECKLYYGEDY